jgi:hypothetical protein
MKLLYLWCSQFALVEETFNCAIWRERPSYGARFVCLETDCPRPLRPARVSKNGVPSEAKWRLTLSTTLLRHDFSRHR